MYEPNIKITEKLMKSLSEVEGVLYPGLEIKGFRRDQKEEAEAWLAG